MVLKRRDFLKIMPLGVLLQGLPADVNSETVQNDPATIPLQPGTRHTQSSKQIDQFYKNAIIIDALVITSDWNEKSYEAVKQSGYTGIQTSLTSENLAIALKALTDWDRAHTG